MTLPKPGSFGLSIIGGKVGGWVRTGMAMTGDASRWTHAFVVVDNHWVVEAMPGGAVMVPLGDRLTDYDVVFCDEPIRAQLERLAVFDPSPEGLVAAEATLRRTVCAQALALVGTPYSYADYPLLGLLALGIKPRWVRDRVADSGHMICSQLVDEVYRRAGIHLFRDGRSSMDVTPGDLDLYRVRALEARAS